MLKRLLIVLLVLIAAALYAFAQDSISYTNLSTVRVRGRSSTPPLSSTGNAIFYFDRSTGQLKLSQNGGAYSEFATGASVPFSDASALVKNSADPTKLAIFSAASISAATTRTFTLPDRTGTLATLEGDQIFTGNNRFQKISLNGTAVGATSFINGTVSIADSSATTIGNFTFTSTGTGTQTAWIAGVVSAHTSGTRSNAQAVSFSVTGSGNGGTTTTLTGVTASMNVNAGHTATTVRGSNFSILVNAGAVTNSIGVYAEIANAGAANVTRGSIFRGQLTLNQAASTFTSLVGLDLTGWAANSGTITTSYGIFADTSIDKGTTRYFIYSESTSPSLFSGRINFGGVTSSFPALKNSSAVLQARLADDSAFATFQSGPILFDRKVSAQTGTFAPAATDSGTFYTNTGDADGSEADLPTPVVGMVYEFYRDANQTVTIDVAAGVTIRVGASVTSDGGNVTLDAVGSRIRLVAISTTQWVGDVTGAATFN